MDRLTSFTDTFLPSEHSVILEKTGHCCLLSFHDSGWASPSSSVLVPVKLTQCCIKLRCGQPCNKWSRRNLHLGWPLARRPRPLLDSTWGSGLSVRLRSDETVIPLTVASLRLSSWTEVCQEAHYFHMWRWPFYIQILAMYYLIVRQFTRCVFVALFLLNA